MINNRLNLYEYVGNSKSLIILNQSLFVYNHISRIISLCLHRTKEYSVLITRVYIYNVGQFVRIVFGLLLSIVIASE